MTINLQATFMAATSAIFLGPAYFLIQGLVVFWQIDMKPVEARMISASQFLNNISKLRKNAQTHPTSHTKLRVPKKAHVTRFGSGFLRPGHQIFGPWVVSFLNSVP